VVVGERGGAGGGERALALDGVRVLAVEHFVAGPYASMWLADHGAQVVKIEPPGAGEQAREVGPFRETPAGESRSLGLVRSNRNKLSVTLDLKQPEGAALFKRLVAKADVVLENLRADSMGKLGLGYRVLREVNPRLIYTSVSGFGHEDVLPGPYVSWPAFDVIVQAMSGLMFRPERHGQRPVYLGFPLADLFAGALAYAGTVQALYQRTVTGEGQHVDVAMYDGGIVLNELALATREALGQVPDSGIHFQAAPFGAYRVADGYLSIAVFSEKNWRSFCEVMGHPELIDDPRFRTGRLRAQRYEEVRELVEGWLRDSTRAEAAERLRSAGVAAAAVEDVDDVRDSEHAAARQMILPVDDPAWGRIRLAGNPIKSSAEGPTPAAPAPALGQHTRELLTGLLGTSEAELDALAARGII
jgi:CoA:oxalate CoA-transferase